MKQQSATDYMVKYLCYVGWLLGTLYATLIATLYPISTAGTWIDQLSRLPFMFIGAAVSAGVIGATFGYSMGLVIGLVLDFTISKQSLPLRAAQWQKIKQRGQLACFWATLAAFAFVLLIGFQFSITDHWSILLVLIPLCIAFFTAIHGLQRYLKKLDAFMSGKSKANREATA